VQDLLLLIHRIPYPPNKGDKIRSWHLLKHLAGQYRVHLATFVDDPDDWQHVPHVEAQCASSHFAALHPLRARVRSLGALAANRSLSLDYYRNAGLQRWVDDTMAAHKIERVLVFSSAMAQYAEKFPQARRVVDFCDVDSDKWRQYADQKSWPMSWLYRHEARQLLAYERQVARDCDASLFVSQPEADLFRKLAPESDAKIGFFNNGVDTDYFSPEPAHANPYQPGERALVFTGAMDYWPNVDAVQWFATDVFPVARRLSRPALLHCRRASLARGGSAGQARWRGRDRHRARRASVYRACESGGGAAAHRARHPEQGARSDGDGDPGRGLAASARRHRRRAGHRTGAGRRRRRFR